MGGNLITDLTKFPAPYYGGKRDAAPTVWAALGDVDHYVEPFCGTCAVLLCRPHPCNRTYYSETVNDLDGLLCNALRSLRRYPDETAEAASVQVCEADMHAIHLWLLRWKEERQLEHLMGDPEWCDPVAGGRWLWGMSAWIGGGWCSGVGPWVVGDDGRITKRTGAGGVSRRRPHLSHDGQGVNRPQLREPGVSRKLPHLGDDGRGVNHAGTRSPGVAIADDSTDDGREFHPMTMPELLRWFQFLSARLRHVRILNGDWRRAVTTGASHTLPVRQGDGVCGFFVDPPYGDAADRDMRLYAHDSGTVAAAVREWALQAGTDEKNRIVVAGFEAEHGTAFTDAGWREVEWFKAGWLKGGMAQQSKEGHQQGRERLWLSPHCLGVEPERQGDFFAVPR